MAAGGNLEYYLNRDVSVITTREIRYQGELSSFDKSNRTITLRNVHNMGTEDRVAPVRVFPSAKTFDFIVFHAEHLKDFRPTPSDSEDPAIVSCVSDRSKRYSQTVMSMLERQAPASNNSGSGRFQGGRVRVIDIHGMLHGKGDRRRYTSGNRRNTSDQHGRSKGNRHVSFKDAEVLVGTRDRGSSFSHIPHVPGDMVMRFVKAKKRGPESQSNSRSKSSSRTTPGIMEAVNGAKVKFDEDYDFQKAFEDFANLSVSEQKPAKEGEGEQKDDKDSKKDEEVKEYYNKGKSFFDNLSTTNADAPRRTRKDELEANKVTFGVSLVRREKWRRPSSFRMGRRRTPRVMA